MAVSVNSVIDRVQQVLQDTTGVRWPVTDELVLWINDAQREIALLKPDASAVNTTINLVAGTKQSIPADGNRLLKVVRNMSNLGAGLIGGRAVRLVDVAVLDTQTPDWHDPNVSGAAAHGSVVEHYVYDESNPRNFYVYPGATVDDANTGTIDEAARLEIIYSANPATVIAAESVTAWTDSATYVENNKVSYANKVWTATDESNNTNQTPSASSDYWTEDTSANLAIPDIYANAIMNYVLYMAYMKDAEFAGNQQRASSHYQLFSTSIAGKGQLDATTSPNMVRNSQAVVAG